MADKIGQPGLFGRLTSLFRSGPTVRRRIKTTGGQPPKGLSSGQMLFRRSNSDTYNATLSSYGSFDRMSRYSDFGEMESSLDPEHREELREKLYPKTTYDYRELTMWWLSSPNYTTGSD